jgi:hypothetical protein
MRKLMINVLFISLIVSMLSLSAMVQSGVAPVYADAAPNEIDTVTHDALRYIQTQQNEDGGIRWFDESGSSRQEQMNPV